MSYILDALRKSETERRQGKVPDLGQQVQLIHRPKKRRASPVVWVALALLVNAGVLAVVFWPDRPSDLIAQPGTLPVEPAMEAPAKQEGKPAAAQTPGNDPDVAAVSQPEAKQELVAEPIAEPARERPTIITPSLPRERQVPALRQDETGTRVGGGAVKRVPHLVELPLSFQKSIPDLMFNSHIYSTDPNASRVMINGHYLRQGDSFSGITVEEVTEDGVVLGKQGRTFRVGIVRDWMSPR
ncbi:general secretion pathway protein GspB [Marinobacter sp.]|uniref:general secretion pathway protein GspB n=1 Tax=Marinobacter sp. TaxID=50741 RepID=UPI003A92BBE6